MTLRTHLSLAAAATIALAGCLFESDKKGLEFEVGFFAETGNIYAYDNAGARGSAIGFGAENVSEFYLTPNPHGEITDTVIDIDGNYLWTADKDPWGYESDPVSPARILEIAGDSTRVFKVEVDEGILLPSLQLKRVASYPGMPCTFSRFRGSVEDSVHGSAPVVVTEIFFRATGDSLRVTARIDTAASRAAHSDIDFSGEFYGTMRVSCP
jgi:hypothetical protein